MALRLMFQTYIRPIRSVGDHSHGEGDDEGYTQVEPQQEKCYYEDGSCWKEQSH